MTVKVMQGFQDNGLLYNTVDIGAYGRETIYFSETSYYFTKTKAVLNDKNPIYQKGESFRVVNDRTGYSVLTLTFSIIESVVPEVLGGEEISKAEFDKN